MAKLIQPLAGKGYQLLVDNWYSGVALARCLSDNGTAVCGTVRENCSGLSKRTANRLD